MNMQVENIPEDLYERLRRLASKRGAAVSEVVISLIEKEIDHDDWVENLHEYPKTVLERSAVSTIAETRRLREARLDWRASR